MTPSLAMLTTGNALVQGPLAAALRNLVMKPHCKRPFCQLRRLYISLYVRMHLLHYQPVPSTLPHGQKTRGFCQCFVLNLSYVPTTMHDVCFSFPFLFFTAASAYQLKQPSALLIRPMSTTDSSSDSEILGVIGSDTSDTVTYRDAPTILLRFPLPECTPFRFHEYLEKTADMFYRLIFDYHQEKKVISACRHYFLSN